MSKIAVETMRDDQLHVNDCMLYIKKAFSRSVAIALMSKRAVKVG